MKSDKQLRWDLLCELDPETAVQAAEPPAIDRRADVDIARAAENLLLWLAAMPRGAVVVGVEDGWVTLSGQLDWNYQRHAATEAVQDLQGVVGLSNLIVIKPRVPAAAVSVDIEAALERQARIEARGLTVHVDGGDVTLGGSVSTCSERQLASDAAWGIPGVRNVRDQMTVRI